MNTSAQNLTSPKRGSSNPHGQHSTILRSPHLVNAKIKKLGHLFSSSNPAYALVAHPHGESGLVTRSNQDAQAAFNAVFCCVSFSYAPVMARLEGDTFACAGFLDCRFTNPLQSCHPHLVMSGKTSFNQGVKP